jgi:glycosyltransferase involved in cell wall biosynthesis
MSDECDRFGVAPRPPDRRVVDSQIAEYELCDLVFVPSELNRRTFIERGVLAAKVCRVPFGVNLEAFRPVAKKDDIFRVLFVGQIGIRKGISYLLEAIAGLNLPRFELCLAGTIMPEGQQFLKRYEGTFRYLGVIPHPELRELYSQASVFVLASIEEGLAYVQAEAMACGLPVIATTNTGAEDLFSDGVEGFIVPIRDPEAIREKVLLLYDNPELLSEMSQAALRRVREIAGWDQYGERVVELYQKGIIGRMPVTPQSP